MSEKIREINAQEFDAVVQQRDKVVVDFYSTECPPCEAFASKYEKAAEMFGEDVFFVKIFRQGSRELAERLEVKSSPTVLYYYGGKLQAKRFSGAIRQSELETGLAGLVGDVRARELLFRRKEYSTAVDVIVLGGGPAGLTAGIYLSQAKLSTLIVDTALPGGYVATTHEVSNYPGFEKPQAGYMLSHQMSEQAKRAGVGFRAAAEITAVDFAAKTVTLSDNETIAARFLVIASGSSPRLLGVPGEVEYRGKGISCCATCDAKYYQDRDVAVIGGGNSAVEESLFISRYAKSVTIIHQFDKLTANREAQDKARANPKIDFLLEYEPRKFSRNGKSMIVEVEHLPSGERKTLFPEGIFIFAGFSPNTALFDDSLSCDQWGYIKTDDDMRTNIPGVFAVGDIRSKKHRQITTAVSDGTIAAIEITKESE